MDKRINKMDSETLQQFLAFRKRASRVPSKKGKGSYNRKDFKKGVQQMTYEEALQILIQLMIENKDVLKRLKEA